MALGGPVMAVGRLSLDVLGREPILLLLLVFVLSAVSFAVEPGLLSL
ncbi:hypothetical protein GCM10011609_51720 [Lentzea pudingi]|uniref:Major facilitator superfamily (MFS) profile domain-containing protein n=1 Tax=Lentzea pudingi TaxID=1789439 RepID=A0ABQ2IF69_9PSEU|nr:hypothetical protein GCM10011609_51720 [Lentzea pudingi]